MNGKVFLLTYRLRYSIVPSQKKLLKNFSCGTLTFGAVQYSQAILWFLNFMGNSNILDQSELLSSRLKAGLSLDQEDLYQCDLSQVDLQGVNLAQASLVGVNFSLANLQEADLQGADLRGANLQGANLQAADLRGAVLHRANLRQANLRNANLEGVKLQTAQYDRYTVFPERFDYKNSGAIGPGANLSAAFLNTANLRNADLHGANLLGAYLRGADLTGANLQGARLSGADLRHAYLTGAYLRNARLTGANLAAVDLRAADLTDAEFEHLETIAGADFTLAQGLSDTMRSRLLNHPAKELETRNSFTRRTTRESLTEHNNYSV